MPPDIDSWRAGSSAIIVGTIDRVEIVDDPVLVRKSREDGEGYEYAFGEMSDCDGEQQLTSLADIYLRDVDTLYGEPQSDEVVIRFTLSNKTIWDLEPLLSSGGDVQWFRYPGVVDGLFQSGERIGGAIYVHPVTNLSSFEFRLFEVVDDKIVLQPFSERVESKLSEESCSIMPGWRSAILDRETYDGMGFDVFRTLVGDDSFDIEEIRANDPELDHLIRVRYEEFEDNGPLSFNNYLVTCNGI